MKRALLVALALLASSRAQGDDAHDATGKPSYRAVVDRVDFEPASIGGFRLRVYLSALALEGHLLDLTDPKSIRLYLGSSEKKAPFALGTFDATNGDLAVVVLVEATGEFTEALPMIGESLDKEVLASLGEHAQVAVLPYGEATGTGKLATAKAVRAKLGQLASDGTAGEPALLDTLDRALLLLRKAKSEPEGRPIRKIVIVIGDGRDRSGDKDRATRIGARAAKEGVRIHSVAYSPSDVRRPLLFLGELSRKSLGTFRWPGRGHKPTADSWSATFKQLHDELLKQYVLSYFVSADDDVAGKRLHVVTVGRTEATSNELKVPEGPMCAGVACETGYCAGDRCLTPRAGGGRGVIGWLLLVGGIGVVAILVLGVIGFVMTKRQQPRVPGAPPPVAPPRPPRGKSIPPPVVAAGLLPNGRPIPGLLVTSGPLAGQRLLLRNGFAIGKQPGSDLLIEDGYTSSQHAQIAMDPAGNCTLYDRGSTNGTYINGVKIAEQALVHGVIIKIGSTELMFLAQ